MFAVCIGACVYVTKAHVSHGKCFRYVGIVAAAVAVVDVVVVVVIVIDVEQIDRHASAIYE